MGRILCIDYGLKRIGLANTDPLQLSLNILPAVSKKDFKIWIGNYLDEEDVEVVIFGYPMHADGNPTPLCALIDKEINSISKKNSSIKIEKVDESFSSRDAESLMISLGLNKKMRKTKGIKDSYSAIVILNEYLESK